MNWVPNFKAISFTNDKSCIPFGSSNGHLINEHKGMCNVNDGNFICIKNRMMYTTEDTTSSKNTKHRRSLKKKLNDIDVHEKTQVSCILVLIHFIVQADQHWGNGMRRN